MSERAERGLDRLAGPSTDPAAAPELDPGAALRLELVARRVGDRAEPEPDAALYAVPVDPSGDAAGRPDVTAAPGRRRPARVPRAVTARPAPAPESAPPLETEAAVQLALVRAAHPLAAADAPAPSQHPALVYLARLRSAHSRRTQRTALETLARTLSAGALDATSLPWHHLEYAHTAALAALLAERYAPATANRHLAALRGTLREAWRLGLMDRDAMARASDVQPVSGQTVLAGRALTAGELRALFASCAEDPSPAGVRDAALLAVLYGAGLRRAEAIALAVKDYDPETGALTVRRGKGRKARTTYLSPSAQSAVDRWLVVRQAVAHTPEASLFLPITKGGTLVPRWPRDQLIFTMARKRARQAGIPPFSPHDCRRTFIGDLLDAGADIATAQQLAGHATVTTTAKYDRRGERVKRQAAHLLHVPYRAEG